MDYGTERSCAWVRLVQEIVTSKSRWVVIARHLASVGLYPGYSGRSLGITPEIVAMTGGRAGYPHRQNAQRSTAGRLQSEKQW